MFGTFVTKRSPWFAATASSQPTSRFATAVDRRARKTAALALAPISAIFQKNHRAQERVALPRCCVSLELPSPQQRIGGTTSRLRIHRFEAGGSHEWIPTFHAAHCQPDILAGIPADIPADIPAVGPAVRPRPGITQEPQWPAQPSRRRIAFPPASFKTSSNGTLPVSRPYPTRKEVRCQFRSPWAYTAPSCSDTPPPQPNPANRRWPRWTSIAMGRLSTPMAPGTRS